MKKLTNQQIYEKYIKKAVKNGYRYNSHDKNETLSWLIDDYERPSCSEMIFNIECAKAFWGEGKESGISVYDGQEYEITLFNKNPIYLNKTNWQYHLQQLAILTNDDRFQYIKKYL